MSRTTAAIVTAALASAVIAGTTDPRTVAAPTDPIFSHGDRAIVRGITRPTRRAEIAVPFDGIVAEVIVREGDSVQAGDELARMDDRVAIASVAAARTVSDRRGPIDFAEAEERLYQMRVDALEKAGSATEFELAEARIRLEQAVSNLQTAREDAAQARRNHSLELARLELHRIRAPFAGRVARIRIRPGESGERRVPVISLVDTTSLDAELNLPVEVWSELEVGTWYELQAGIPVSRPVIARLRSAQPDIDAATRSVRCVFEIPNPDAVLPSGFAVHVPATGPRTAAAPSMRADSTGSPVETAPAESPESRADADADAPATAVAGVPTGGDA